MLLATAYAVELGGGALSGCHREMQEFNAQVERSEKELSALGVLPDADFDPRAELPAIKPGETAVISDSGMYFDNEKSCLIYMGNIRLNDARVHLRAAHRLYVLLPEKDKKAATQRVATPERPAAPPASTAENQSIASSKAEAQQVAAEITVHNAAVDVPGNRALMEGRRGAPSITMVRQDDSLTLQTQENGVPAWVYADSAGNVLLIGTRIVGVFVREGERRELTAQRGPVFYEAATRTLTVHGPSTLSTAQGTLRSSRQLRITFSETEEPRLEPRNEPFSQFVNMQLSGVERAEAQGGVLCTMPEQQGRPAARASGDTFSYDATTGACFITGKTCAINYGGQSLTTSGKVELLPNGDATITGDYISGTYERPAPAHQPGAKPIAGTYTTRGTVRYVAEENSITFPSGLSAKDTAAQFQCSGIAKFYLLQAAAPMPPRKPGTPNLAIAHQQGVAHFTAKGNVRLHTEPEGEQEAVDMSCDAVQADLLRGTAHVVSFSGQVAYLRYGDYTLKAQSPHGGGAELQVMENGDLLALGDHVQAMLPGEKGTTTIDCSQELHLQRAECLLIVGPDSTLSSPDGIMTANAQMRAVLSEEASTQPKLPKYPHLSYHYNGLRNASTSKGGSLRSAKLSMQCEGPLSLSMLVGKPGDNPRDLIKTATAQGRVRLAGKDARGKIMRADGDRLDFDHASGNIYLRGSQVSLMDVNNTHTASGPGACVTIDPKNNVHISGENQTTTANRIHQQIDSNKKK